MIKLGKIGGVMNKYHAKKIVTPRLIIRKPKITDAEDMFKNWANDVEVTKYLTWDPHPSLDVTRMILSMWINLNKSSSSSEWLIIYRASKQAIGSINVYNIDQNKECDIGFCISRQFWNKGLMSETVYHILKYIFSLGIKMVRGSHIRENVASGKVMRKNHMRYTHTIEGKHNHLGAVLIDYYVITANDWKIKTR